MEEEKQSATNEESKKNDSSKKRKASGKKNSWKTQKNQKDQKKTVEKEPQEEVVEDYCVLCNSNQFHTSEKSIRKDGQLLSCITCQDQFHFGCLKKNEEIPQSNFIGTWECKECRFS